MDIYGRNAVLEYLRAMRPGSGAALFVSEGAHGKIIRTILDEAAVKGVRAERCDKEFFAELAPSSTHQGVALRIKEEKRGEGDGSLLERVAASGGVLVLLDQVEDPHNTGAIIRSAEALGADGVVITRDRSAGVTPAVVKASAGATAHIPVVEAANAARFLDEAKGAGFWIVGSDGSGERSPRGLDEYRPAVLVIGSEGSGMRRVTGEKCDLIVKIPLRGRISSLNASVAAGILLYELLKAGHKN